jgi:hypothetical protein
MSRFSTLSPRRIIGAGGLTLAFAVGALIVPASMLAKSSSAEVRVTGSCTLSSTAKLKAHHDDGRIEYEFEVDQNRNNRLWSVRVWDDGHRVFTGTRRTHAPGGSFSLDRKIANRAGTDTISARAVNATTGEVCRATLNV